MPHGTVDCSAIPRKVYCGRDCFDWPRAKGALVPFRYGAITGVLEILHVEKAGHDYRLTVRYEGAAHQIPSASLTAGNLGKCVGVYTSEFRYPPGRRICDEKRDLTILDVYRGSLSGSSSRHKMLTYRCNRCGSVNENVREGAITRGSGCPVCNGKITRSGVNDIPSSAPWMIPYFPGGRKEAGCYTANSGRRLRMSCPYCGRLSDHPIAIATLHRTHSIGCPCGDGISFPEKFLFFFFQTFPAVQYTRQVSAKDFPWCGRYRYDGMFQKDGAYYFVEAHGLQHFAHTGYERIASADLAATQENDRRKKRLALANGIAKTHYIVLDCRKSTLAHLRTSILASPLAEILELHRTEVDWEGIFIQSLAPLQKKILDYARAHPHTPTKEIAKLYGVHPGYPARILNACGGYGKRERAARKSKVFFEHQREQLFLRIRQMLTERPGITVAEIAAEMGRNRSGLYALLRKYGHTQGIDLDALHRNAEAFRLKRAKEQLCKPVSVLAPDGVRYVFPGLTEACQALAQTYGIRLPLSSVSVSIARHQPFRGFLFRYGSETAD